MDLHFGSLKEARERQRLEREEIQNSLPKFSNGLEIVYCYYFYCVLLNKKSIKWLKPTLLGTKAVNAQGDKDEVIKFCEQFSNELDVLEYIKETQKESNQFFEIPLDGWAIFTGPEFAFHSDVYENHKLLTLGESYEIDQIKQYSSWTEISLKEFPGKVFSLSFLKINKINGINRINSINKNT